MKTRTFLILVIILVIAGGAAALITWINTPDRSRAILGRPLLDGIPVNETSSITIEGATGSVVLGPEMDRWVVKNRFGYPADFSRISDFLRSLKQAKIGRSLECTETLLRRLSLKDPDERSVPEEEKGIRVSIKDKEGVLIAGLLIGEIRRTGPRKTFSDGRYVKLVKGTEIYLIDRDFSSFKVDPSAWLDKDLLKVDPKEVKRITCVEAGGKRLRFALERPARGKDLEPVGLTGQRVKKSALNRLAGALASIPIKDVAGLSSSPESLNMDAFSWLEYSLFDGLIVRVSLNRSCTDTKPCYLGLQVSYEKPSSDRYGTTEAGTTKKAESGRAETSRDIAVEAKNLNLRLSRWIYVIPEWKHGAFIMDPEQLVEKPGKNEGKASEKREKKK